MNSRSRRRSRAAIAIVCGLSLIAAACGDDDDEAVATTAAPATTAGGSDTTEAPDTTQGTETTMGSETTAPDSGSAGCPEIDTSLDADGGTGTGRFLSDLECAISNPLQAEGEPIVIGFQNPEGDPNGSFPEFTLAAQAATDFINNELGGLGADIQNGIPGRPIELVVCKMAIAPDESQRCANELLTEEPTLVVSSINFFGNHFPVYAAANVPVVVITPITVGDFTSPGVYAIGGGGGCLGVHTGMVEFATTEFEGAQRFGIPWADTPPGVVCYHDLEKKPMDVLRGDVAGDSERAGSMPDLEYIGVPIKPATPDVTPQVTEVLDFDPDVILFSAQGADCWNLVDGLGRLGWTPQDVPLVLSGACIDFEAMEAAGALAEGIYLIGSSGALLNDPAQIEDPRDKLEAEVYQTKLAEYGLAESELRKGFATQGAIGMFSLWELASQIVVGGGEVTSESLAEAFAATDEQHLFGSTPLSCATAPAPYVAVCNATVSASQWDGDQLVPVRPRFTGIGLVAGTELKPGP